MVKTIPGPADTEQIIGEMTSAGGFVADEKSTEEGAQPQRPGPSLSPLPPDPSTRYQGSGSQLEQLPPLVGVSSTPPPPPRSELHQPFAVESSAPGQWGHHPTAPAPPTTLDGHTAGRTRKPWTKTRIAVFVGVVAVVSILGFGILAAIYLGASNSLVDRSVPASAAWGDCYNNGTSQQPVDCSGPHHYEVYSRLEYSADTPYPNFIDRRLGDQLCEDDFEAYTGDNFFTSEYDYAERFPSEDQWNNGNRITVCVLFHSDFKRIDTQVGDLDAIFD